MHRILPTAVRRTSCSLPSPTGAVPACRPLNTHSRESNDRVRLWPLQLPRDECPASRLAQKGGFCREEKCQQCSGGCVARAIAGWRALSSRSARGRLEVLFATFMMRLGTESRAFSVNLLQTVDGLVPKLPGLAGSELGFLS